MMATVIGTTIPLCDRAGDEVVELRVTSSTVRVDERGNRYLDLELEVTTAKKENPS